MDPIHHSATRDEAVPGHGPDEWAAAEACGPKAICPPWPAEWFYFCSSRELRRRPVVNQVFGRELVAFRTASGRAAVMTARCAHMAASLGAGQVVGETIQCPFHHWQFGTDGRCVRIPASSEVPCFARQVAFPTVEQFGGVFFCNADSPRFDLPFFDDVAQDQLYAAAPLRLQLECPWYLVGANGVDVQHFQATHGRQLTGGPTVDHPEPHIHRTTSRFRVVGHTLTDLLTRWFAGPEVTMKVVDWSGTLFFVQASFRRTRTYGMVALLPHHPGRTSVYVRVWVRGTRVPFVRPLMDHINALIRRYFIRKFLEPDVVRAAGTRFDPRRLIDADRQMADYFRWLQGLHGPLHAIQKSE